MGLNKKLSKLKGNDWELVSEPVLLGLLNLQIRTVTSRGKDSHTVASAKLCVWLVNRALGLLSFTFYFFFSS